MKKILFLSSMAILFTLAGCGNAAEKEEQQANPSDTNALPEANRDSLLDAVNKTLLEDSLKK